MKRLFALLCLVLLGAARDPILVPEVSQHDVQVRQGFTGTELLLFGAILDPQGTRAGRDYDIVVVLKGPTRSITLREKQKHAGIWVNAASAQFRSAPSFYAVASSRPIKALVDQRTAAIYELGLDSLQLSPTAGALPQEQRRFDDGFVDLRRRHGLYSESAEGVEITDGVLYRARITIPARVPVGAYTAETFLIQDGKVVAGAARDITIDKEGMERFVANAADRWSLTYGFAAIALSLVLGWVASVLFRRR